MVATADFVLKRMAGDFGAIVPMYALRARDLRLLLSRSLVAPLGLTPGCQAALVEDACGDARQLCVQASFAAKLSASSTLRDHVSSPYDKVRCLLGGGRRHQRPPTDDLSHQELCLMQENCWQVPMIAIEELADLGAHLAETDAPGPSDLLHSVAARACLQARGHKAIGWGKLREYQGWAIDRKRAALVCHLQARRWAFTGRPVLPVCSLRSLAVQTAARLPGCSH